MVFVDTLIEWLIGIVIIAVIIRGVIGMFMPKRDDDVVEVKPRRRLK